MSEHGTGDGSAGGRRGLRRGAVVVGVLGASFVFAAIVRVRLSKSAPSLSKAFSSIGMVAPIVWLIVIVGFVIYAVSQIGTLKEPIP